MTNPIHFLLTPDRASSRIIKRKIAEQPSCLNVVGTWLELINQVRNNYILPQLPNEWQQRLEASIIANGEAFWMKSLKYASSESQTITETISQNLMMLLEGTTPDSFISVNPENALSSRTHKHLVDLVNLYEAMGRILPPHLSVIKQVLEISPDRILRPIQVYYSSARIPLNPWQRALIDKLTADVKSNPDKNLEAIYATAFIDKPSATDAAIGFIQSNLFTIPDRKVSRDNTIQCLAVRDYLQEAEVAASMIQKALIEDESLSRSDFALLLPDDDRYLSSVGSVFSYAGIPISGLGYKTSRRDLGTEAVYNLLLSLNKPAPLIALASLLVSPLMPWDCSEGNRLAQEVIDSRFKLPAPDGCCSDVAEMLSVIRERVDSYDVLKKKLACFASLLNKSEVLTQHRITAQTTCAVLLEFLDGKTGEISWQELRNRIVLRPPQTTKYDDLTREGVAIFHESEEPWRKVRRLFVLGCSSDHYPREVSGSKIFTDSDLTALTRATGLALLTTAERTERLRILFRRQLCAASEHITYFVPRRDSFGKALSPSASLTFAAALFNGVDDDESLLLELDRADDLNTAHGVPTSTEAAQEEPCKIESGDLHFDKNLLELGKKPDGTLKPESPSRLETLMVSPLAWLFERLGIEPREWTPETLDVMAKGTLAHAVFEHLFAPGKPLPSAVVVTEQVPMLLEETIHKIMPFLRRKEWKVEREHLKQDILKAAIRWSEILHDLGAEVIATEIGLEGTLDGFPIHGNADLLLSIPGKRLYVVDYKKAGSGPRRKRMEKGYDHQAELYRTMIKTGGLKDEKKAPEGLAEKLTEYSESGLIGTLYYLMNDQKALADTSGWVPPDQGLDEIRGDSSINAMKLIKSRFAELRSGRIMMNSTADEKDFKDNKGMTAYCLNSSPLMRIFMKEDQIRPS